MNDWTSALAEDSIAIFLFHGVVRENRSEVRNYTRKHLVAAEFERIVERLAASGAPVSMDDIVAVSHGERRLPPRAFAVTFDDGFANNLTVAKPILARHRVPATFYVTSGFIDAGESSWIDKIEYAFDLRPTVSVTLPSVNVVVRAAATTAAKRQALEEIRRCVKQSPVVDPYDVAADIWQQLDVSEMVPNPDLDDKLTWLQVRELADDPLCAVGGHGHTHRILEFLSDEELHREVETSVSMLAAHTGRDVRHYSYPEGLAHCYSDRVIRLLKNLGIVCAPSAMPGVNHVGDDLFHLRRIQVA